MENLAQAIQEIDAEITMTNNLIEERRLKIEELYAAQNKLDEQEKQLKELADRRNLRQRPNRIKVPVPINEQHFPYQLIVLLIHYSVKAEEITNMATAKLLFTSTNNDHEHISDN